MRNVQNCHGPCACMSVARISLFSLSLFFWIEISSRHRLLLLRWCVRVSSMQVGNGICVVFRSSDSFHLPNPWRSTGIMTGDLTNKRRWRVSLALLLLVVVAVRAGSAAAGSANAGGGRRDQLTSNGAFVRPLVDRVSRHPPIDRAWHAYYFPALLDDCKPPFSHDVPTGSSASHGPAAKRSTRPHHDLESLSRGRQEGRWPGLLSPTDVGRHAGRRRAGGRALAEGDPRIVEPRRDDAAAGGSRGRW